MKVLVLIQARMSSTRLPNKVMMEILDKPMIAYLLERLSHSSIIHQVVVATSEQPENTILAEYVESLGVEVFRGSEEDVLDRFYKAARKYKGDVVVRITADCPLIDVKVVDRVISSHLTNDADYTSNVFPPTYPDGLDLEVFSFSSLEKAYNEASKPSHREHVTPYIRESGLFKTANVENDKDFSTERWTVDEPNDFLVIDSIYKHFHPRVNFNFEEVLALQINQPEIFSPNKKIMRNEGNIKNKIQEMQLRNITDFKASDQFRATIHELIPGGAHTYSKGDDQFPILSPAAIAKGKGSHIWDVDGNEYIDCPMGLTSVSLGHAYEPVLAEVRKELENGVNFQRPSILEKKMAGEFLSIVPGHDRIKFAKNGSIVTTAAVKLARAKTGRKLVAFPKDHPFYSYDDWFIGTTSCNKGVPEEITNLSLTFQSYDISSIKALFEDYPDQIACIITEPEKSDFRSEQEKEDYLREAIAITHANGALFIMDEMVTGFKTAFPGTMTKWNLEPDMATWGKGIANGFSFCALTGKKDVMDLGGITRTGEEKVFLISTTHGGETHTLSAALATIKEFKTRNVIQHNHSIGDLIIKLSMEAIKAQGLEKFIQVTPTNWLVGFSFTDAEGIVSNPMRTLIMQEMIKRGVLFQGAFVPCFSHTDDDVFYFVKAFEESLKIYNAALTEGVEKYLIGESAKAVFRRIL